MERHGPQFEKHWSILHSVGRRIIDELHKIWKEAAMALSRYFPGTFVEDLRNTTRGHSAAVRHANEVPGAQRGASYSTNALHCRGSLTAG